MRSRTPDRLCAEAVELARAAAEELAGARSVGEHLGAEAVEDRVVTHSFASLEPAYRGWRWAVTLTRAPRSRRVTVDESVLLPHTEAVLAPDWVPWSERLRPGDMGPGDLLPTVSDDPRLEPGWASADERQPGTEPEEPAAEPEGPTATSPGQVADAARQLGMGRARVLSPYGLDSAADRWEQEFGPDTPMARAAPAQCASCGFLLPLAGRLRQAFGICGNEHSPADGRVVSLAFGCGGHSEAAVSPTPPPSAPPALDELRVEPLPLGNGPEQT